MISNTETIPGRTITATLGLVTGSTVRAKNVFKDIGAGFKNVVGGELTAYTELLGEARNEAMLRMMQQRPASGNAIVNVRFATSAVAEARPNSSPTAPQFRSSEVIAWRTNRPWASSMPSHGASDLLIFGGGPFLFSWLVGNAYQKRKLNETAAREKASMQARWSRPSPPRSTSTGETITHGRLLTANVSIGPSWWQLFRTSLKQLIGGRIYSLDGVLEFGRREALQRLREVAQAEGVDHVINVRLDTAEIVANRGRNSKTAAIEIFAYGTGVHVQAHRRSVTCVSGAR